MADIFDTLTPSKPKDIFDAVEAGDTFEGQLIGGEVIPESEMEVELGGGGRSIGPAVGMGVARAKQVVPAILAAASQADVRGPTAHEKHKAFTLAMEDPRYMFKLMESAEDPANLAKVESLFGPGSRQEYLGAKAKASRDIWAGVTQEYAEEARRLPRGFAMQGIEQAQTQGEKFAILKERPLQTVASVFVESAPPSIVGATAGTLAFGPGWGTAAGVGLSSAAMEYSSTLLGEADKANYDVTKEDQFAAFLDSDKFEKASQKAAIRAGIVGGVDAATAGLAGRFIGPVLKEGMKKILGATAKEVALQAAGGGLGELGAQLATREPGEAVDLFDVTLEAATEVLGGPVEVYSNIRKAQALNKAAQGASASGAPGTAAAVREQGRELAGAGVAETELPTITEEVTRPLTDEAKRFVKQVEEQGGVLPETSPELRRMATENGINPNLTGQQIYAALVVKGRLARQAGLSTKPGQQELPVSELTRKAQQDARERIEENKKIITTLEAVIAGRKARESKSGIGNMAAEIKKLREEIKDDEEFLAPSKAKGKGQRAVQKQSPTPQVSRPPSPGPSGELGLSQVGPTYPQPEGAAGEGAAAPVSGPQVAKLGESRFMNERGHPIGTTYYATPEDWAAWERIQERGYAAAGPEWEALKNKYGGMPPVNPATQPVIQAGVPLTGGPAPPVTSPQGAPAAPEPVPERETITIGPEGPLTIVDKSSDGKTLLVRYKSAPPDSPPITLPRSKVKELTRNKRPPRVSTPTGEPTTAAAPVGAVPGVPSTPAEDSTPVAEDEDPEDIAMQEAINEAVGEVNAAGLPANVVIRRDLPPPPSSDAPFAQRKEASVRVAYPDKKGNIVIVWPMFKRVMRDIPPAIQNLAIKALILHESIHVLARSKDPSTGKAVVSDKELAALWNSLTPFEKALARKNYTGDWKGINPDTGKPFTDEQMGHEYLRRAMEWLMSRPSYESQLQYGFAKLSQKAMDLIERIVIALRRMARRGQNLTALLDRMKANLGKVREGAGSDSFAEPEAFDAYHGTWRDFERFIESYIGRGAGGVAFGHGLYLAMRESYANIFRLLTRPFEIDGHVVEKDSMADQLAQLIFYRGVQFTESVIEGEIMGAVTQHEKDLAEARHILFERIRDKVIKRAEGHLYKVHVNVDEFEVFLQQHLPFRLQSQTVQQALIRAGVVSLDPATGRPLRVEREQIGHHFYEVLANRYMHELGFVEGDLSRPRADTEAEYGRIMKRALKMASDRLNELGVRGGMHPDDMTGRAVIPIRRDLYFAGDQDTFYKLIAEYLGGEEEYTQARDEWFADMTNPVKKRTFDEVVRILSDAARDRFGSELEGTPELMGRLYRSRRQAEKAVDAVQPYNYVLFDTSIAEIIEKDGQPVARRPIAELAGDPTQPELLPGYWGPPLGFAAPTEEAHRGIPSWLEPVRPGERLLQAPPPEAEPPASAPGIYPEDPDAPYAYQRKAKPSGEGQQELNLGAAAAGGPPGPPVPPEDRISATEARRLSSTPLNPRQVAELADQAVNDDEPDFKKFVTQVALSHDVPPGELREIWQDAVLRRVNRRLAEEIPQQGMIEGPSPREELLRQAEELEARASSLGTIQATGEATAELGRQMEMRVEGARIGAERPSGEALQGQAEQLRREAAQLRAQAEQASAEPTRTPAPRDFTAKYREGERRKENRIATEAVRLINMAYRGEPAALRREKITPEDVRASAPNAVMEFERDNPPFSAELVENASVDRSTRQVRNMPSGVKRILSKRRVPEGTTHRVTGMRNSKTGEIRLLSTFREGKTVRIYDPRFTHLGQRPHINYEALRNQAPEWYPINSLLLDQPVRNFSQWFQIEREFEENFMRAVRERYAEEGRRADILAEGEEVVPRLKREGSLNESEAGALYRALQSPALEGDVRPVQDVVEKLAERAKATPAVRSPETHRVIRAAKPNELTGHDWATLNALNKIQLFFTDARRAELQTANPERQDEIYAEINRETIRAIDELARQATSGDDFIENSMGRFTREFEAAPVPPPPSTARPPSLAPGQTPTYKTLAAKRRAALAAALEQREPGLRQRQEAERYQEALRKGAITTAGERPSQQEERLKAKEAAKELRAYKEALQKLASGERTEAMAAAQEAAKEQNQILDQLIGFSERIEESMSALSMLGSTPSESATIQDELQQSTDIEPGDYGEITSPDSRTPLAFLRPGSRNDRLIRRGIGSIRAGLNWTLGSVFRAPSEWMVDRLRRGAKSQPAYQEGIVNEITGKINQIISKSQGYLGEMNSRFGDDIMQIAGQLAPTSEGDQFAGLAQRMVEAQEPRNPMMWLNGVQVIEPYGTAIRNSKEAIEGRLMAPDFETAQVVAAGQEANYLIGQYMEAVIPNFIANGNMSSNWTPTMLDAVMSYATTRGSLRETIIRGMALANRVPASQMRQYWNTMRRILSRPGISQARVAAVSQDFSRRYPRVVTDVWMGIGPAGHWEPVIHATFHDYFHHGIRKAAMIRAFRETYPRNEDGSTPEMDADYAALRGALPAGGIVDYSGTVDALFRVIQGQPSESTTSQQVLSSIENAFRAGASIFSNYVPLRGVYDAMSPLFRALMLTGQIALQPAELLSGANQVFFGYKRGFVDSIARLRGDYAMMEQLGLVDRMIYNDSVDPRAPARSIGRIASNLVRRVAMENAINEAQEAQNAMGALVTARRIIDANNGRGPALMPKQIRHLRKLWQYMGFTRPEINAMMLGDEDLLMQMQRKTASWFSAGHKHPAERSRLVANRLFQKAFWFWDYPMARLNQLIKISDGILEDAEAGRWDEAATGTKFLARFMYGLAVQGTIQVALIALFSAGLYGLRIRKKEAEDDKIGFLVDAMKASLGGPIQQIMNGYDDRGLFGVRDNIRKLLTPTPYSIIEDMTMAYMRKGKYRDLERWEAWARFATGKTPGYQALKNGVAVDIMAAVGSGTAKDMLEDAQMTAALKAFYRWRRDNYGAVDTDSYLHEDIKAAFHTGMRMVKDGLLKGDEAKMEEGFEKAAAGLEAVLEAEEVRKRMPPGQRMRSSIARSLETQNVLKIPTAAQTYRPMQPSELEALQRAIGEDAVEKLQLFDAMLEQLSKRVRPRRPK